MQDTTAIKNGGRGWKRGATNLLDGPLVRTTLDALDLVPAIRTFIYQQKIRPYYRIIIRNLLGSGVLSASTRSR